ncbi:hypothetical protein NL450_27035, partial [Klebsiella pneumoniae]|nr:hypothetical protein [Klebsiella pneumoniae]
FDEQLFAFFATSQLVKGDGTTEKSIGQPAMYLSTALSPDKKYLLSRTIRRPFSYLVSAYGFPSTVRITDLNGKPVQELAVLPSSEGTPSGY